MDRELFILGAGEPNRKTGKRPQWVLAYDNHQWIIGQRRHHKKSGNYVEGRKFVTRRKSIWKNALRLGIELTEEAMDKIEALPDTFMVWINTRKDCDG